MPSAKPRIHVLEARKPKRAPSDWLPLPSYSSNNGPEYVMSSSASMRSLYPDWQFRVVAYVREEDK